MSAAVQTFLSQDITGLHQVVYDAESSEFALADFHASLKRLRADAVVFRLCLTNLDQAYREFTKGMEARLKAMFFAPDIIVRLDSSNFLVAVMGLNITASIDVADNIKRVVSSLPYQTPSGDIFAEIEIKAAQFSGKNKLDVKRLYETLGILPDSFLDASVAAVKVTQAQTWSAEAILAVLNGRSLEMAYQPIIKTSSAEVHHYEALMRIVKEDGSHHSAGEFIMAAETHELAHLIDHRALELSSKVLRENKRVKLAVNISADTLKTIPRAKAYLEALRALGPNMKRLTLELTETAALEDLATACMFSEEARSLGCEFAIDDFGAGHTSFKNLMAIEADTIKIDRSFVAGIAQDRQKQAFVRMITDLAQIFAIETVAEGIEIQADAECLKAMGVDYFQGYLFGKPRAWALKS